MELNDAISRLGDYSSESNIALNEAKTNKDVRRQMSRAHALHDYYPAVSCNGKLLERVTTAKIQGVHMDEHLTWVDHVTALSSCYAALAVRRKRRNLAQQCSQAVSGVISDVKTGLRVRRLLSHSRIPNEMAARVQRTLRGLPTWAVHCFRGLAEIKLASNLKKGRPSTTENHS